MAQQRPTLEQTTQAIHALYAPNSNPQLRQRADQFLTTCMAASWGWELGASLLTETDVNDSESSFFGAHILCQKCTKKIDIDNLKPQMRAHIITVLFNVLGSASATTHVLQRSAQCLAMLAVGDAQGYGLSMLLLNDVRFQQLPLAHTLEILKRAADELSAGEDREYVRADFDDVHTAWECVMKVLKLFSFPNDYDPQTTSTKVPLRCTMDDLRSLPLRQSLYNCVSSWAPYGTSLGYLSSANMLSPLLQSVATSTTFLSASSFFIQVMKTTDMMGDVVEAKDAQEMLACLSNLAPALATATQAGGEDDFCAHLSHLCADILLTTMDYITQTNGESLTTITNGTNTTTTTTQALSLSVQCTAHASLRVSEHQTEVWERLSELPAHLRPMALRAPLFTELLRAIIQRAAYVGSTHSITNVDEEGSMEEEDRKTYRRIHAPDLLELCYKECRQAMEAYLQSELSSCLAPHRVECALYVLKCIGLKVREEYENAAATTSGNEERKGKDQQIGRYFEWIRHAGACRDPCWCKSAMGAMSIFLPWIQQETGRVEAAVKYTISVVREAAAAAAMNGENLDVAEQRKRHIVDHALTGFSELCSRCARNLSTPEALSWMLTSLDPTSVLTLPTSSRIRITEALFGVIVRCTNRSIIVRCTEECLRLTLNRLSSCATSSFSPEDGRMDINMTEIVAADVRVVAAALTRLQYVRGVDNDGRTVASIVAASLWSSLFRIATCVGNVTDNALHTVLLAADSDLLVSLCHGMSSIFRTVREGLSTDDINLALNVIGRMFSNYRSPKTLSTLGIIVSVFGGVEQWHVQLVQAVNAVVQSSGGENIDPDLNQEILTLCQQCLTRCPKAIHDATFLQTYFVAGIGALSSTHAVVSTGAVRLFATLAHMSRRPPRQFQQQQQQHQQQQQQQQQQQSLPSPLQTGGALSSCLVLHGRSFLHALLHGIGHNLPLDTVRRAVEPIALWNAPFRQYFVDWANQAISGAIFVNATKLGVNEKNSFVLGLSTIIDGWNENAKSPNDATMEEYRQLVYTFAGVCRGETAETVEKA